MKGKGLYHGVVNSMAFVAGILLVGTVFIVCFEIFMRYFARKPQVWSVEACEYMLFGIAFFGAPWLLSKNGHVSIDVVAAQLSDRSRRYLELFSKAVGIIISAIICWFSGVTAWNCFVSGVVVTKTLTIPKFYFLSLISLGYFVLLLEFLRQFLENLKGLREGN